MARGKKTGGRRPGSPNKTTVIVKEAVEKVYHGLKGDAGFLAWAKKNPTLFYIHFLAKMIPRDILAKHSGEVQAKVEHDGIVTLTVTTADVAAARGLLGLGAAGGDVHPDGGPK